MTTQLSLDIWIIDMRAAPARDVLLACLSNVEIEQASHHAHPERFIARRAALRHLLSSYCEQSPSALELLRTDAGKPYLRDSTIGFSVSHSRDLWVLAVAPRIDPPGVEVGVDIEVAPRPRDVLNIAKRYFDPREVDLLSGCSAAQLSDAFYARWTLKEAYLKARGTGIAGGLAQLAIAAVDPVAHFDTSEFVAADWQLAHRQLTPDTHLALAYRDTQSRDINVQQCSLAELFHAAPLDIRKSPH